MQYRDTITAKQSLAVTDTVSVDTNVEDLGLTLQLTGHQTFSFTVY